MTVIKCCSCGKDIYIPDSWILHQSHYQETKCPHCGAEN